MPLNRFVAEDEHVLSFFRLSLLKSEDKLHLGIKNEQIHFILLSVCIIFVVTNK